MTELLERLNEAQRQAALHQAGPAVVFAGAGSGKTRVITTRIARLIQEGVSARAILALTFTNKAAAEMRERILSIVPSGQGLMVTTFHAACARWLREFAIELGFTGDFTIYDEGDSKSLLKNVLKDLNVKLDEKISLESYRHGIAHCKTQGLLPNDVADLGEKADHYLPEFGLNVYRLYQERLAACNAMDFGDLILNMLLLLRHNAGVLRKLSGRYQYVLVDEYQDTNPSQFELISHLVGKHRNLFVVGDDDQSIYSWRGANPSNILDFDVIYPDCKKYFLEQNYRSSATIINASAKVIENNRIRVAKRLWTDQPAGEKIRYACEYDGETEAWWLCEQIEAERKRFPLRETAVFYRTNSQSRPLEEALLRHNIPYQIYGAVRFYERAEIKDLLAYLKLIGNENDDVSFERVVNTPTRGIGDKALAELKTFAATHTLSYFAAMRKLVKENTPKLGKKFAPFLALMEAVQQSAKTLDLQDTLEFIIQQTGYLTFVTSRYPDRADDKLENVAELGAAMAVFVEENPKASLADWLQGITLEIPAEGQDDGVSLMTLHMAKGLEFERVFIVGVEEGILPHRNSLDSEIGLEEERRLFYVGMTRARTQLSLVSALRRRMYDRWVSGKYSRFLTEIPSEYISFVNDLSKEHTEEASKPRYSGSLYTDDDDPDDVFQPELISPGVKVEHLTFGRGIVERVENDYNSLKVVVNFNEFGLRRIVGHHLRIIV